MEHGVDAVEDALAVGLDDPAQLRIAVPIDRRDGRDGEWSHFDRKRGQMLKWLAAAVMVMFLVCRAGRRSA
jgi:hypothetical protein